MSRNSNNSVPNKAFYSSSKCRRLSMKPHIALYLFCELDTTTHRLSQTTDMEQSYKRRLISARMNKIVVKQNNKQITNRPDDWNGPIQTREYCWRHEKNVFIMPPPPHSRTLLFTLVFFEKKKTPTDSIEKKNAKEKKPLKFYLYETNANWSVA